jgi:adenosine deaminase
MQFEQTRWHIDMTLEKFIRVMPKVELHVHLKGSIRPKILLKLAELNNVSLPASTIEAIQQWFQFSNFNHFAKVYKWFATVFEPRMILN